MTFPQLLPAKDGLLLSELYVVESPGELGSGSWFRNLSGRARVSSGAKALIGGFVVTGDRPLKVLIRGVGPGLTDFGVSTPLADPRLSLYGTAGVLASNEDWKPNPQTATRSKLGGLAAGAFSLANGSKERRWSSKLSLECIRCPFRQRTLARRESLCWKSILSNRFAVAGSEPVDLTDYGMVDRNVPCQSCHALRPRAVLVQKEGWMPEKDLRLERHQSLYLERDKQVTRWAAITVLFAIVVPWKVLAPYAEKTALLQEVKAKLTLTENELGDATAGLRHWNPSPQN